MTISTRKATAPAKTATAKPSAKSSPNKTSTSKGCRARHDRP